MLPTHDGFNLKCSADSLYLPRLSKGRRLIYVEDIVETNILRLKCYVRESEEQLIVNDLRQLKMDKHHMNITGDRWTKEKHSGYRNNHMDNLSDRQLGNQIIRYGGGNRKVAWNNQ